MKKQKGYK